MRATEPRTRDCPCGSGARYTACCGPWHAGQAAPSAEALMRSRYSAYTLCLRDYLLDTWHPSRRPASLEFEPQLRWLGLEVRRHHDEGDRATVEFVARSRLAGRAVRLHETSSSTAASATSSRRITGRLRPMRAS